MIKVNYHIPIKFNFIECARAQPELKLKNAPPWISFNIFCAFAYC